MSETLTAQGHDVLDGEEAASTEAKDQGTAGPEEAPRSEAVAPVSQPGPARSPQGPPLGAAESRQGPPRDEQGPPQGQAESHDTAFAVLAPAASEAASLLTTALGLEAKAGQAVDLWGAEGAELAATLSKDAKTWGAPLMGKDGVCGELALALLAGAAVPGEGRLASALAACVPALTNACGAQHLGKLQRLKAEALLEARPGQRALALPLASGEQLAGLLVVTVPATRAAAELPHLEPAAGQAPARSIASLSDVEMTVSVELGRTKIAIKDLLTIHNGAVVQLDRAVSHPVDVFVNGTLIARGEVVVVDECFAVRVTELITGD